MNDLLDYELASPYDDEIWERATADFLAGMFSPVSAIVLPAADDILMRWEGATVLRAYDGSNIVATFTAANLDGVAIVNISGDPEGRSTALTYNGEIVTTARFGGTAFTLAGIGQDEVLAAAGH